MADQGNTTEPILYCYKLDSISSGGVWNERPLHKFAIPVLLWQMVLAVIVSRGLAFLLKPLRQPRVVAEILVASSLYALGFSSSTHAMPPCDGGMLYHDLVLL